ncbi:type I restriction-modification protein subunit S [Mameliella alba]|uniref:restriction endonuclease subunit S n=1 Tax=Mameliella alba TaxID=561184 RepID=UPI0013E4E4B0|nr:restriction endonuclease subunit S [Mameliella alba]BBU53896.1 type I restriction-modification protein subunit S [Mameliella alba]
MSAEVERALVALWKHKEADGWRSAPLKFAVRFSGGGTPDRTNPDYWNGEIPWVSPKDMKAKTISGAAECITEEGLNSSTSALVRPGTVLVVARSGILKHSIPVGIAKVPVAINQDLKAMVFNETADPEYYAYFIDGHVSQLLTLWRKQGATVESLDHESVANTVVPVPPLPEQRAIAGFLDRETAKIDALVEEQRRLIALLKEKRQAVISHAVTKGLDPAGPMKPSGIDWLGDIPAHWQAVQAKRFVSIINGFAFPSTGFETDENAVRLLRGINVGVGEVRWEPENTVRWTRKADDKLDAWELQAGDLVLGMDRPWISSGVRVAVMQEDDVPSLLLQRVAALRTHQGLVPPFLYRQLQSEAFVHHFLPETTGVSVPHISPSQIGSFVITVPPEEEQQEIVEHIDEQIRQFGELEAEAERAITLLQERRSALISAAVTGKIDLRDTTSNSTEAA